MNPLTRTGAHLAALCATAVLALAGCGNEAEPSAREATRAAAKRKDPALAKQLIGQGAVVIDVRTPDEYTAGHVADAVNLPLQELPRRLVDLKKLTEANINKPIVVYCASGARAGQAKLLLEAEGYTQVVNGGGLDDLQ